MTSFPKHKRYKDSGIEWLGEVPEHWEIAPFQGLFDMSLEKNGNEIVGEMLSISGYRGVERKRYESDSQKRTKEQLADYRVVRNGQLAVNTMWLNYAGLGVREFEGHMSPAYRAYDIRPKLSRRYAHHLLRSSIYVEAYTGLMQGIRPNSMQIKNEDFKKISILVPTCAEQVRIVAFLDQKTAEIDALIAKKQRQIELLDEQKAILINRAVTRGLNPNAKLKPSGIEWLPKIPDNWSSVKLRHLAALIQTGPFGSQLHSEEYVENGTPIINPSHMRGGRITPDFKCAITDKKVAELARHKLRCGDIVFARRGELGRCGLVTGKEEGWICGTGSLLMRPKLGQMNSEYLVLALSDRHVGEVLTLQSVGSTMDNLNTGMISDLAVPLPPIETQATIVEAAHEITNAFRKLQLTVESQIESLKTLRSNLIAHAVTGRIKV